MRRRLFQLYVWKTAMLMSIAFVMAIGLITFSQNRLLLLHQHPYFARMYAAVVEYDVSNWLKDLVGAPTEAINDPGYASSVPVLVYHGIRPGSSGENISIDNFTNQMLALKHAGWQTVSIQDFYDFMRHGKKLPPKSFLMTFDDGRKDSYYPVDPLLAALHYRATMFVITKSSFSPQENKFYLDKTELNTMQASGRWDLQPHAAYGHYLYPVDGKGKLGHFFDNKLWLAAAGRLETDAEFAARTLTDLKLAKTDMQQQTGSSGIAFAFPFNEFGGASINYPGAESALMANVQSVYPIAFYQIWPNKGSTQNYPEDPSFLMKRILIDSSVNSVSLLQTLDASSAKQLPYSSNMTTPSAQWLYTWGDHLWDHRSGLTITATPSDTGAATFLDGVGAWQNYAATAAVELHKGVWARILGRFHNDKNYASCTYSASNVLMEETVDDVTHDLGQVDMPVPVNSFTPGLKVNGSHMECQVNGQTVLSTDQVSPSLNYGGIGFASYDPNKNNSQLSIKNVHVVSIP